MVGVAGRTKPAGKTALIVPAETSVPAELEVKPTVQVVSALAASRTGVKETVVTDGSIVYGTGSAESSRRSSSIQPPPDLRTVQRAPAGVTSFPARSNTCTGR